MNGRLMQLTMITIPQSVIIVINIVLYILTWFKIRRQQPQLMSLKGYERRVTKRAHKAAKNMILFVSAFLIQWCPVGVFTLWTALHNVAPLPVLQCGIISSNIGGLLNGFVFMVVRHQQKKSRRNSMYQSSEYSRYSTVLRYQDVVCPRESRSSSVAIMAALKQGSPSDSKGRSTESGLNSLVRRFSSVPAEEVLPASAPPALTLIMT